ncbi:MAG: tetratricopeptide repeat protein, partial [Hyphomonadaceae bacterium]|nr:tetratricopeptide repeat protein [Hyphomonadaceae bacterium]
GLGNTHRRLGAHAEAIAALRRAIELAPGKPKWHEALTEAIWQAGGGLSLSSYQYAIERLPQDASLRLSFAHQLNRVGARQDAEDQARAALALAPERAETHDMLAQTLVGQKRYDEAVESYGRAAKLAPRDKIVLGRYAETLVLNAQLAEAHDILSAALAVAPHDQENLARMTILLRLLGEERAYAALADYDALSQAIAVKPPEGYRDIEAFHAALAPYLLGKHLAKAHPTDQTLRGGTQTLGALFSDPHPLIQGLRQSLFEAVQGFVSALPEDRAHPFSGRRGRGIQFSGSWSVRLASGGFHTNHIHPAGWISSAYYVSLPSGVSKPGDHQGWFKMGETNPDTSPELPAERWVRPEEGKLVLFPSYFWHGTQSFAEGSERLTVAFDIVPTD